VFRFVVALVDKIGGNGIFKIIDAGLIEILDDCSWRRLLPTIRPEETCSRAGSPFD